jgi:hypothetical protein
MGYAIEVTDKSGNRVVIQIGTKESDAKAAAMAAQQIAAKNGIGK